MDALLDRSEDLAKGWLLALLEQTPLDDAPRILATDLTREGPRLCEAVLRAIGSDADQRRLEPQGPLAPLGARVGELAGATGARDTAQAVDALQDVVWAALRAELRDPDPDLISELAERLAQVTAVLRGVALADRADFAAPRGARALGDGLFVPGPEIARNAPRPAADRAQPPGPDTPGAPPAGPGMPGAQPAGSGTPGAQPSGSGMPGAQPGGPGMPPVRPAPAPETPPVRPAPVRGQEAAPVRPAPVRAQETPPEHPAPPRPPETPAAPPHPGDDRRPAARSSSTHTLSAVPPPRPQDPGAAPQSPDRPQSGFPASPPSHAPAAAPTPEPRLRAWVAGEPPPPEPAALWVGALADEIARSGAAPLSLLLAELEDADRVLAVEPEPNATFSDFSQAVRRAVRRQDMLVSETAARAWVIARDTDRASARALAERISASVREARPWRGAPLVASVGFAVLGQDGFTPGELIQVAEEARFAASAGSTF